MSILKNLEHEEQNVYWLENPHFNAAVNVFIIRFRLIDAAEGEAWAPPSIELSTDGGMMEVVKKKTDGRNYNYSFGEDASGLLRMFAIG